MKVVQLGQAGLIFLMTVSPLAAQTATLPTLDPVVESCRQAAANSEQSTPVWSDLEPCEAALGGDLSPRERVATLVNFGLLLSALGDLEGAARHLNAALALDSRHPEAWLNRANLNYLRGDFVAAIADYTQLLSLSSLRADLAYLNRGMAQQNLGRLTEAEADYRAALALRPDWTFIVDRLAELSALGAQR